MMTNEELVCRIKAGVDTSNDMLELYNQMKGAIFQIAKKYNSMAEQDDLTQEGYLGLCYAVEHYEPDAGSSFVSYAWHCIRGFMLRYIQKDRFIPVHQQGRIGQYKKLCNAFIMEYGRKPTNAEISHYLALTLEQVEQIGKSLYLDNIASLESPLGDDDGLTLADTVSDGGIIESDIVDRMDDERLKEILWDMVDSLPGEQPEVLKRRYQNNESLQSIGDNLGISRERVRQQEAKGLRVLRHPKHVNRLRPYVGDYIATHAYQGGISSFNRTWTSSTEWTALGLIEKGL